MHIELGSRELFEISRTRARGVEMRRRFAAWRRPDDAGVEETSTRSFDQVCDFVHRVRRDRIAVDNQRMATRGPQRIYRDASETDRCSRIHDREHDIALINEPRERTNID